MTASSAALAHHLLLASILSGVVLVTEAAAQGSALTQPPQTSRGAGAGTSARPAGQSDNRPMGPWEWWNDVEVQRELGLSSEKVRRINDIYSKRSEALRPLRDEFMKELNTLDKVTQARTVDEATFALQVTKVEGLRSELSKSRTVMLYSLYRELSPEQYRKLQVVRDRRAQERDRGRGPQPK